MESFCDETFLDIVFYKLQCTLEGSIESLQKDSEDLSPHFLIEV